MFKFNKSDLYYTDYKRDAKADHDNPKIIGTPDNDLLNRYEGYEVLYFIKSFAKTYSLTDQKGNPVSWDVPNANHLERLIREKLPSNIRSHRNVADWILKNW